MERLDLCVENGGHGEGGAGGEDEAGEGEWERPQMQC